MVKTSDFIRAKKHHKRWVALTAYDAPTAALLETCGVDILLVGDSLGMVLLGYSSTLPVTMDEMIHHAKAVRRGAPNSFIVGDLPYQGVRSGARQALRSAKRFLKEGGCDAVKLEWSKNAAETTALLVKNKVPVMGHVGLTPQQVRSQEGFKVHGRRAGEAFEIFRQARLFEDVGAFSVLVECVPAPVVRAITRTLRIPTLGIGSGKFCDGQVLVFHDLVGIFKKFTPKFVKQYARLDALMERAVKTYRREVLQSRFPGRVHSFKMEPAEWDAFHRRLRQEKKLCV